MPVRVGFSRYRKEMLERELETITQVLPMLGVEKVILTGDMITEDYAPDMPKALAGEPHPGVPPLSVATPALYGRQAVDLDIQAPARPADVDFSLPETGLFGFPPQPERFAGS